MTSNSQKEKIERAFGGKVSSYSRHAVLQKQSAKKLCDFVEDEQPTKILEIGCGTGFLTENLQQKFPNACITSTDISKEMIYACQQKFIGYRNIDFKVMDGETIQDDQKYDLIITNLTVQWFEKPVQGLNNLCKHLTEDGKLYFTTIGAKSFWQWLETLETMDLPSGILNVPNYDGIFEEEETIITYKNGLDFLRSFKNIGAHQPRENYKPLSQATLQKACKAFDIAHQGKITWHILYGALNSSGSLLHQRR